MKKKSEFLKARYVDNKMKFTDGEKLIILMLSEMYEKLGIDGEIDPEFIKSAIFNDKLWSIRWKYPGIPFDEADDPQVLREVIDILDMWSFIEYGYAKLSDSEKAQLEEAAKPFGKNPEFRGFDGNNESSYMGTALFLVNELDRFQEFKGRNFNSHSPSIDSYRRMLAAFEPIRNKLEYRSLSVDELAAILTGKLHPNSRHS
jgi:uncharacterized protein